MTEFRKYAWLGPIRMIIISLIALGYASTMPKGPESAEVFRLFGYDPSWYGISVIFMLTGWLAMRSLQRHGSATKFLVSRVGRNLPILAVFAAMVPLVLFPLFGVAAEPGASRLSQHLSYFVKVVSCYDPNTLTPGLLDNALYMCVIQGGLWTFRWGLVAFIVTAILWAIGGLRDRRILLGLTVAALATYVASVTILSTHSSEFLSFAFPGLKLGWAYLMGMTAYAFKDKIGRNLLVPIGLLGATFVQYFLLPWTPLIEVSATLALGYLAYYGFTSARPAPVWLRKTPDLSLGLYVFNWPMAQIVLLLVPGLSSTGLFAVSYPLTIILSLTLWFLIKRNVDARLHRHLNPVAVPG